MQLAAAGVVFDVDGTLLDSNYFHTVAWWRAFRAFDLDVPMYAIHRCIGMGSDKLVPRLLGRELDGASEEQGRQFAPFRGEMRAFPGAGDLLRAVAGRGLAVVLGTSAKAGDIPAMRAALGADEAIAHITSSQDVPESKPSPDIFAAAIDAAGLDPSRSIAVGDTGWDVEAASRLGVACVAVLSGGWSRVELEAAGAVAVYRHPADLLEHLDESPIAGLR